MGFKGGDLDRLTAKARNEGWLSPAAGEIIKKLMALRSESDAHTVGTDDFHAGMFAIHLVSSILLFLSKTKPFE